MTTTETASILIRPAYPDDRAALERLAALDGVALPSGRMLVAEVGGEIHAAVDTDAGVAIADPFRPTAHLVDLLRVHAQEAGAPLARTGRARAWLRGALRPLPARHAA